MPVPDGAVLTLSRLLPVVRRLRRAGKTIAFTNGCFDILHAGHLAYLSRIKKKADCLIVAVNSDSSVRRIKGAGRPVVPARERAALVAALKPVDYVTVFSEPTPLRVIRAVRPDLLVKGADWKGKEVVGREIVESSGGRVLLMPYLKGRSTTRLLGKIRESRLLVPIAAAILSLVLPGPASAARIAFKDRKVLEARILAETPEYIEVSREGRSILYLKSDIQLIERTAGDADASDAGTGLSAIYPAESTVIYAGDMPAAYREGEIQQSPAAVEPPGSPSEASLHEEDAVDMARRLRKGYEDLLSREE